MKLKLSYLAMATSALMFASCGGGPTLGDKDASRNDLIPAPVEASQTDVYKQNPDLPVITAKKDTIYDAEGKPLALRGISALHDVEVSNALEIGGNIASLTGSNVVRLLVSSTTTAAQLKSALDKVVETNMVAIVSLRDASLRCTDDPDALSNAVKNLWLKDWIAVLSAEKFQSHLMINIADGWGPTGSYYTSYFSDYRTQIQRFRTAGFKSPLIIDAPNCGKNYRAFLDDGAQAFVDIDPEHNIVLSVQPDGELWNTNDKLVSAFSQLDNIRIPYIVSSLTGSGVGGKTAVDHLNVMEKAVGDRALQLNLPWISTSDSAAYTTALTKPTNLKGGSVVSLNAFMDSDYLEMVRSGIRQTPAGKTKVTIYIKDVNGNRLALNTLPVKQWRAKTWQTITAVAPADNDKIDAANLLKGATSFDLSQVTDVGVQVLADGKPVDVKGKFKFDDLQVYEGVPPVYATSFVDGTDGWSAKDATASVTNGTWSLLPTGKTAGTSANGIDISLGDQRNTLDFSKPLEMKMRVFIPKEYEADLSAAWIAAYAMPTDNVSHWDWQGIQIPSSSFKPGEWSDVKVTLLIEEKTPNTIKNIASFGVQLGLNADTARTAPILIDSIEITDPTAKKLKPVVGSQYKYTFADAEGFVALKETIKADGSKDWAGAETMGFTAANGELSLTTTDGMGTFLGLENRDIVNVPVDLTGPWTVKTKLFIPAGFTGDKLSLHIFMMDSSWSWFQTDALPIDISKAGDWTDVSIVVDPAKLPKGFNTKKLNYFGVSINGIEGFKNTTFKLKDFEFIGTTYVDDSTPILNLDFSKESDFTTLKIDFTEGGFSESALVSAASLDYKIRPFGWLAAPWIDNADAALDLVGTIDTTDPKNPIFILTARGDEIVFGALGIKNTSQLAGFPPVPGLPVKTN